MNMRIKYAGNIISDVSWIEKKEVLNMTDDVWYNKNILKNKMKRLLLKIY